MLVVSVLLLLLLLLPELLMAVLVTAAVAAAVAAAGIGRRERLDYRGYTVHSVKKIEMIWQNGDKFDNQKDRSYIRIDVCSVTQVV